jgi:membrane protease YdiL (CAAX protease family)
MPASEPRAIADQPELDTGRGALREAWVVYAVVSGITWLLSRFQSESILRTHLHLVVGMLFLVTALRCAERLPGGAARYGLSLGGLLGDDADPESAVELGDDEKRSVLVDLWLTVRRGFPSFVAELGVAALVCALVFPPFVWGFYLWHAPTRPFVWLPDQDLPAYALTQVLVVGLPEEALFRGYLQGRLQDAWPNRGRLLGASLSLRPWVLQAALFAVLHVAVDYNPARLAVFFPALLFGWLRGLRSGIGAAIFVHAACNVLSDVLIRGWL